MLAIRDPNKVPFGGAFVWKCSECEATFRHHTPPHVFEQALKHSQSNGHPFSNELFTQSVCEHNPEACHEVDGTGFPTLTEKAVSVAKAVISHARNRFKGTDEELKNLRLSICSSCVYYGGEAGGTWFSVVCKKCGCSGLKLKIEKSTCPLGLW